MVPTHLSVRRTEIGPVVKRWEVNRTGSCKLIYFDRAIIMLRPIFSVNAIVCASGRVALNMWQVGDFFLNLLTKIRVFLGTLGELLAEQAITMSILETTLWNDS